MKKSNHQIATNEIFNSLALKLGKATLLSTKEIIVNNTDFNTIRQVLLSNQFIHQFQDEPNEPINSNNWFGYDKEDEYFYIIVSSTNVNNEYLIEISEE